MNTTVWCVARAGMAVCAAGLLVMPAAGAGRVQPPMTVSAPTAEPPTPTPTPAPPSGMERGDATDQQAGVVVVASLVYANDKSAVCFADDFLREIAKRTAIVAEPTMVRVNADSADLFRYPFAVMTGEQSFTLTEAQRTNLRDYLEGGGFLVASAGCSSKEWASSFRREIRQVFPDRPMQPIDFTHPMFHTVYSINKLKTKKRHAEPSLEGLEIDGRIVLVFSVDGLNDTAHAGGNCCCCGGDEITNARDVNVNLLAYSLTH